jgi:hypothetical protein
MQQYHDWSDKRLKCELLSRVTQGALPYGQWGCVFANPELAPWPNLQRKAFCVWLPTLLDYVRREGDLHKLCREVERRELDCGPLSQLGFDLLDCCKAVLGLYTREEQIFLTDRRLQNVHGYLSSYDIHDQTVRSYDSRRQVVQVEKLSPDEYRAIMNQFYPQMVTNESMLLERLVHSEEGRRFHELYQAKLTAQELAKLAKGLEVFGGLHIDG